MVREGSIVTWLDIHEEDSFNNSISNLFMKYSDAATMIDGNMSIGFGEDKKYYVKMKDLFGWTDLISITKFKKLHIPEYTFKNIYWIDKKLDMPIKCDDIIVDESCLIPLFSKEHGIGFHGEVKYNYKLFSAKEIFDKEYKHNDYLHKPFKSLRTCSINHPFRFFDEMITRDVGEYNWYEIKTKSGWFLVNNLLLFNGTVTKKNGDLYK